jgi:microcystin-dependent protein
MADPFVGEIRPFAGNFAPAGWALCNGQLMSIAENTALFSLIGTTYGGDGQTTFALPDLQGRALIHQGTSPAGIPYVIGQRAGVETVTLTLAQLPAHAHGVSGSSVQGTSAAPGPTVAMAAGLTGQNLYDTNAISKVNLANQAVGPSGAGQPHDNRQPYLAVTYIISLFGIFPSRN